MAIDLIILGCILVFGLLGAVAGGAAQIGQLIGVVLAFFCARPLGKWLGPKLAAQLSIPQSFGVIIGTILVFLVVLIATRIIVTMVLKRLMTGRDPEDQGTDRALGLALAVVKVTAISYVIVSALAFVEDNVTVAGRRIGLSPRDSYAFKLARKYNLFERTQFAPVKDLVRVAKSAQSGDVSELQKNPAFRALQGDPRFQKAMEDADMQRAIETGDYRALLENNYVMQLIQDPTIAARLAAAARASE